MTVKMSNIKKIFRNNFFNHAIGFVMAFSGTHLAIEHAPNWGRELRYVILESRYDLSESSKKLPYEFWAFVGISQNYDIGRHNCKHMAQEVRDVFSSRGIPPESLRLVHAVRRDDSSRGHMWLEVKLSDEWRAFDPSYKRFDYPKELADRDFRVIKYYPGDFVYLDKRDYSNPKSQGYKKRGDQWNSAGQCWVNPWDDLRKLQESR